MQDLLRHVAPPRDQAVEFYHRLLAINELSVSMNAARDTELIRYLLAAHFRKSVPEASVHLFILEGSSYKNVHLSGPDVTGAEAILSTNGGIAGSVLRSGMPLWIPVPNVASKTHREYEDGPEKRNYSFIALPFWAMNRVIGCLILTWDQPKAFDKMEVELGMLVASHLSSAMENILTRQRLATANARLRDHELRLTQLNEKLQQLAHTDEATGLFNKRRLFERLEMEIARAKRYGEVLGCLMIDVDDFKAINDTHGHQAGDQILAQIGMMLRRCFRVTDFAARYGGEEFTVLLPRTNSSGAYRAAEKFRANFMAHEFSLPAFPIHLTASVGVACCTSFDRLDAQHIIGLADEALYRAKKSGKNKVCFANET